MRDESKTAHAGRRGVVFAGTAFSVLAVGSRAQRAQAQQPSPRPSTLPATGTFVMVAPTDAIAAIQTKLKSVPTGGTLTFPANSAFNFNGRTIRGKSGITILANGPVIIDGAPGPGSAGVFDFGGMSSWVVRGKAPGQGFIFNNTLINADAANGTATAPWAVGNCVFNNVAGNGLNGSAIRMTGTSFGRVINNDFNGCLGNVLGQYDWDNIDISGNKFIGCWQPVSIDQGTDINRGRNIKFIQNLVTGELRAGFETGGDISDAPGAPGQVFTNLLIQGNWFVDLGPPVTDGAPPISVVARGQTGTRIQNNFLRLGNTLPPGNPYMAIEVSGTGVADISGNLLEDFPAPLSLNEASPSVVHDNRYFNCGALPAGLGPSNVTLARRPAEPSKPARIVW